ncbi:uncharacterized protein [Epargyreus clarus]|uniref:uncharacterized protein isoform X3 n=1 Tax=Epargyreus clarus TaxID=520877 RepID=UPI003C2D0FBF
MAPDKKKTPDKNKAVIQTYLNTFKNNIVDEAETTNMEVNGGIAEDEETGGITYFVDDEGRYYYQPAGETQNVISLAGATANAEAMEQNDTQMLVDGDGFQTVTLVPSETSTGEVSYVLVVQEETKPVVNLDIKVDEQEKGNDVYTFNDEEEGKGATEGGTEPRRKTKKGTSHELAKNAGKFGMRSKFSCNLCTYASHRRYLLLRHMKSHSDERPHRCSVCDRGFKTIASLQNHMNMHNGVKPYCCKYCNIPFTTSGELVRHVRYKHTHEKPHKCSECDYASVELSKLRRHVRCHTGERPYQCQHCTYASPDTFKLKRHLRTHTGEKPYKCDHCNMCFTQSNSLKAHKLIHNVAEKPVYSCELCPAKCGRKTDLRIHVQKLHTSEKPLKCKRCGKTFPDRYSCKMHNKTHEGEKCFKCEVCPYASTTFRHLKSHMLKHTGEKPFSCDQCDQSFRQIQLLRRHQNLYHNPDYVPKPPKEKTHTCHECKRTFAHKGNLIRHLAVHDPESGHHERSLALKLGRQKMIVPDRIDEMSKDSNEDDSEDEDGDLKLDEETESDLKRGELVTVGDSGDQQYVVLEVIQLEDGTEQQIAVVAPQYTEEEEQEEESYEIYDDKKEPIILNRSAGVQNRVGRCIKLEKEVDSCFGFDDDDDAEDEEDIAYNDKVSKMNPVDDDDLFKKINPPRILNQYTKVPETHVELDITYDKDPIHEVPITNTMTITYDKDQETTDNDTLPILYEDTAIDDADDLVNEKLYAPTLEAIADLPSDSLLTLVTIITDEEAASALAYDKDNEIPIIPDEGENITYMDKVQPSTAFKQCDF